MGKIYAIGDVHGCIGPLRALLGKIETKAGDTVVFLGDYVDRGPASKEVIATVQAAIATAPEGVRVIALKGNHEDMMVQVHRNRTLWDWWLRNGGDTTLESYGPDGIPCDVLDWCEALPVSYQTKEYFFAHAGVHPDVALADQDSEDLLWIRDRFLNSEKDFGAIVVHGHTPESLPEWKTNRINVDTGCVYRGNLTAVVLGGAEPEFISVPWK